MFSYKGNLSAMLNNKINQISLSENVFFSRAGFKREWVQ